MGLRSLRDRFYGAEPLRSSGAHTSPGASDCVMQPTGRHRCAGRWSTDLDSALSGDGTAVAGATASMAPNRLGPGVRAPPLGRAIVLGTRRATRNCVAWPASHLMKVCARGVAAVVGGVDLEV